MPRVEIETQTGMCPTHGQVEATREIPRLSFPFLYYGPKRSFAKRRQPYTCPTCGSVVTPSDGPNHERI